MKLCHWLICYSTVIPYLYLHFISYYSIFAYTFALKRNSRSRLSSKRPPISHYIIIFVSMRNSTRLHNLRTFLLAWTKWHHWVPQWLQKQANIVERMNLPLKINTLCTESDLVAKWTISLWTWWNTLRKRWRKVRTIQTSLKEYQKQPVRQSMLLKLFVN